MREDGVGLGLNQTYLLILSPKSLAKFETCKYIDQSPAFLTSDCFIRSNVIVETKWLIYCVIFCSSNLMISSECKKNR